MTTAEYRAKRKEIQMRKQALEKGYMNDPEWQELQRQLTHAENRMWHIKHDHQTKVYGPKAKAFKKELADLDQQFENAKNGEAFVIPDDVAKHFTILKDKWASDSWVICWVSDNEQYYVVRKGGDKSWKDVFNPRAYNPITYTIYDSSIDSSFASEVANIEGERWGKKLIESFDIRIVKAGRETRPFTAKQKMGIFMETYIK